MSDTQNNQNEDETKKNPENPPELCTGCMQFYGNPQQQNLCSKCFNLALANSQKENQAKEVQIIKPKQMLEEEKCKQIKQKDTTHCQECNKKVGYYGYQCKCLFTYCNAHRLPENHNCTFDFKEFESQKLQKQNPQLKHDKVLKF